MHNPERDPHSGYKTTGHEWNGIKELNTPVPKAIWWFLIVTHVFALVYWVLMPTWPLINTYTKGLLNADQQKRVEREVRQAAALRQEQLRDIEQKDYSAILADAGLMAMAQDHGRVLFEDNCSACHGTNGQGQSGFPTLADNDWLWGGSPQEIAETIRVGVNSEHPESRFSEMLAFGRDQLLQRDDLYALVNYIETLSAGQPEDVAAEQAERGKQLYAENCAVCHGENAEGSVETGAPNLADDIWIYGTEREDIYYTLWHGRIGSMPAWEGRLSPLQQKILTLYILGLQAGGAGHHAAQD